MRNHVFQYNGKKMSEVREERAYQQRERSTDGQAY